MKLPVQILVIISILLLINLPRTALGQYYPEESTCTTDFIGDLCESNTGIPCYSLSDRIQWIPVNGTIEYIVSVEYGVMATYFIVSEPYIYTSDLVSAIPLPNSPEESDTKYYIWVEAVRYSPPPQGSKLYSNPYVPTVTCEVLEAVYQCRSISLRSRTNECCGFAALDSHGGGSKTISTNLQNTPTTPILTLSPNPFQDQLKITTDLPQTSQAAIHIYNATGQLVRELNNEGELAKGTHVMEWDTSDLLPGIYYCVLKTGEQTVSQKVVKY